MTDDDLEDLREQESRGDRMDRDAAAQNDFVEKVVAALDQADDGNVSETITAYDPTLAALLTALDEDDRLDEVVAELQEEYDGDAGISKATRSAVIRLAIRVGLQEASGDVMADLTEAVQKRQSPTV